MSKTFRISVLMLLLISCTSRQEELERHARTVLADLTTDPNAMQLDDVHLPPANLQGICGSVNFKNTYGGYEGFKIFHIVNDKAEIAAPEVSGLAEHAVRSCGTPQQIKEVIDIIQLREWQQKRKVERWKRQAELEGERLQMQMGELESQ